MDWNEDAIIATKAISVGREMILKHRRSMIASFHKAFWRSQIMYRTFGIAVGTRFKINGLGAARCPSLAGKTGTVHGVSRSTTGLTVLFDGDRRPTCLHRDYISPVPDYWAPRQAG